MTVALAGWIATAALLLLGWICVAYAGAGRGDLRGHAGESPALANVLHLIGLVSMRPPGYRFFIPHLLILFLCLAISLLTINLRADERPRLGMLVRAAYALGYVAMAVLAAWQVVGV